MLLNINFFKKEWANNKGNADGDHEQKAGDVFQKSVKIVFLNFNNKDVWLINVTLIVIYYLS